MVRMILSSVTLASLALSSQAFQPAARASVRQHVGIPLQAVLVEEAVKLPAPLNIPGLNNNNKPSELSNETPQDEPMDMTGIALSVSFSMADRLLIFSEDIESKQKVLFFLF
jgi:hypothetical protein